MSNNNNNASSDVEEIVIRAKGSKGSAGEDDKRDDKRDEKSAEPPPDVRRALRQLDYAPSGGDIDRLRACLSAFGRQRRSERRSAASAQPQQGADEAQLVKCILETEVPSLKAVLAKTHANPLFTYEAYRGAIKAFADSHGFDGNYLVKCLDFCSAAMRFQGDARRVDDARANASAKEQAVRDKQLARSAQTVVGKFLSEDAPGAKSPASSLSSPSPSPASPSPLFAELKFPLTRCHPVLPVKVMWACVCNKWVGGEAECDHCHAARPALAVVTCTSGLLVERSLLERLRRELAVADRKEDKSLLSKLAGTDTSLAELFTPIQTWVEQCLQPSFDFFVTMSQTAVLRGLP